MSPKVRIRVLKKIPKYPAPVGGTRLLPQSTAERWVDAGYAEMIGVVKRETKYQSPADMLPVELICGCGFVGKRSGELKAHKLTCPRALLKLNVGCGTDIQDGFTNIDCRDLPGVDIIADASNLSSYFRRGSVDLLLANDIIEHFPQAQAKDVLAGWVALIRLGGTLELRCPDVTHAASIAYSDEWLIHLLYGGQDYPSNFHQAGFTLATMTKLLSTLGLTVTHKEQTKAGNMYIRAVK